MSTCGCKEHATFSDGKSFKVYKIKSKKHRQRPLRKLIDNGYLDERASAVCTACIEHSDKNLHETEKSDAPVSTNKRKSSYDFHVQEVILALRDGKLSPATVTELAQALGECLKNDIFNDSLRISHITRMLDI